MITKGQIGALAKDYQIDEFTVAREYLQLLFLSYLYQKKEAEKIYFKGGTAIRLLFGSPRFSEDLDFSTTHSKIQTVRLIKNIGQAMNRELPELKIILIYSGKNGLRFRIKLLAADFKYPLTVRLDFTKIAKPKKIIVSPILSKFPIVIFPLVCHLPKEEILAEKICALATRSKGRDFFDLWYLLEKEISLTEKLVKEKFKGIGKTYNLKEILKKIKSYPQKKLVQDLTPFLPRSQRKIIPLLKTRLQQKLALYLPIR